VGVVAEAVPLRLLPETANIGASGRLTVGGIDLVELSREVGPPAFVYDEEHLRNRCREAREAFGDGIAYASKAFLCRAMASLVDQEGMMIDVASGGELYVAVSAGVPPSRLVLHGSNKSPGELAMAIALGVGRIVVDSFDEIDRLERMVEHFADRSKQAALLRINPGIEPRTHASIATGQEDSKFGLSVASGAAGAAIDRLRRVNSPVDLVGLHARVGSQVLDLSGMERTVEVLAPLLLEAGLDEMCVGGGLGVAYTATDGDAPSLAEWAQTVHRACQRGRDTAFGSRHRGARTFHCSCGGHHDLHNRPRFTCRVLRVRMDLKRRRGIRLEVDTAGTRLRDASRTGEPIYEWDNRSCGCRALPGIGGCGGVTATKHLTV
jgi:diaminopimelate decarboxylase